jgi:hypothetical protein
MQEIMAITIMAFFKNLNCSLCYVASRRDCVWSYRNPHYYRLIFCHLNCFFSYLHSPFTELCATDMMLRIKVKINGNASRHNLRAWSLFKLYTSSSTKYAQYNRPMLSKSVVCVFVFPSHQNYT